MFNKLKKSKDTNPYNGYVIKYGNDTLTNIRNRGGIPMTIKWQGRPTMNAGGTIRIGVRIRINGTQVNYAYLNDQLGEAWVEGHYDVDQYFNGNIESMKNCSISVEDSYGNGYMKDMKWSIIKWLEPIGGGANRLSKWFSCLFQKGGEQYV